MIRVWLPIIPQTPSTALAQVCHDDVDQSDPRPSRTTYRSRLYYHTQTAVAHSNPLDNGLDLSNSSSPSRHILYACCGCSVKPFSIPRSLGVVIAYLGEPRSAGSIMLTWLMARLPTMLERYKGVSTIRKNVFYTTDSRYTISTQYNPRVAGFVRPDLPCRLPCSLRMRFR